MEIPEAAREIWHSHWLNVLIVVSLGTIVFLNLRWKKLKLPPGPVAVPIFGNWLQVGDDLNHNNLSEMANKYGDIFLLRMGQRNLVVVSSPDLAKEVLHTQGVEFGSRTRNVVFDIFTNKGQDMVFTVYGDHWRRMRRIMTLPFFTSKVVQQSRFAWEHEIEEVVKDLRANPKSFASDGVVIRRRLQMMMYNIMYRMMFGTRFEREDDPLFEKLKLLNGERSRLAQSFDYNYGDFIPFLRPFLKRYLDTCRQVKDERIQLFKDEFVEPRRQLLRKGGGGEKVAVDHLFEALDKGEINDEQLLFIIENINVAAIETTLWSIEWGIAELVNNPSIQTKLQEELDLVLGGEPIKESDFESGKLPFLTAVVKETMRRRMAIPFLVPHMNLHAAKLGGYDIPAESKILVNAWWIANSPKLWDSPLEFRPERFLDADKVIEANGSDFTFLPFGAGRRSCPGIIIALPLLHLVLGRLFQCFQVCLPSGVNKIDMTEKGGQFSLRIANHYHVVLKPRETAAA